MDERILFILTGGTIDSTTKGQERDLLNKDSVIPEYLAGLGLSQKFEFITACWKDSRDISDEDRNKILSIIKQSLHKKIIITHGTYTIAETGKFLRHNLSVNDKIIILTGSLVPLHGFENSDAPFNLKFSIEQANALSAGVYVCMNGKAFDPENVAKDQETGNFYSI